MSAEKLTNKTEQESNTQFRIHWPSSKETVSGFVRAAQEYEFDRDSRFFMQYRDAGMLGGLLYNLGHFARGLQDFPSEVTLNVPEPTKVISLGGNELQVTTTFSQLLGQIADEVERYVVDVYRRRTIGFNQPRPDALQKEIDGFRALINKQEGKSLVATFLQVSEELFMIPRLKGEGFQFSSTF